MNNGPGSLNRNFRLVWNDQSGCQVPAPETARGRGKRSSVVRASVLASLLAGGALAAGGAQAADPPPQALPQGGQLVQGQAQWRANAGQLQITQGSDRAAINWQQFQIGSGAQVRVQQPGAGSVLLNRVLGADPSAIHGRLQANGQVLLVNPNGIVFGKSAQVDVGGLVASTLQISDADFAAGRHVFRREGTAAAVRNQGTLRAARGGHVALLAPEVVNDGVISAELGTVALAAGETLTLRLDQAGLLDVAVAPGDVAALVANRELVQADGGRVILSAGAAQRLRGQAVAGSAGADALVSDGGAPRLVSTAGRVQAAGGQVQISGATVDVDGRVHGERISLQADHLNQNGLLDASSAGAGGQIRIDAGSVVQTASAALRADGATAGGHIRVDAGRNLYSSAQVSASSADGQGGDIALTADRLRLQAAGVAADGGSGGGRVRIGGGYQGRDADLAHATDVGINGSTVLRADALAQGDGGQVVVWSDGSTTYGGRLSARGGAGGGDGGRAEVSGKQTLHYAGSADLSAASGKAGTLLLDPRNIIVDHAGSALATLDLSDPTPGTTADSWFGVSTRVLANGNVIIASPKAATGGLAATGAVYLFDSRNGALLANLRGANADDQVGMGTNATNGLRVLPNGNYLVLSPSLGTANSVNVFNGTAVVQNTSAAAGAITWQSATGGGSSTVSSSNSVLGSTGNTDTVNRYSYSGNEVITNHGATSITANDRLGGSTTQFHDLTGGDVLIANSSWYNGRGAAVWMDGSTGQLANGAGGGVISAANALVGATANRSLAPVVAAPSDAGKRVYVTGTNPAAFIQTTNSVSSRTAPPGADGDRVGQSITLLPDGGYVVASPLWSGGGLDYRGAVTFGSSQGTVGTVSTANSLVGANSFDYVGSGGIKLVGNGHYLVDSPLWAAASNTTAGRFLENNPNGAVTWVDGRNGQVFGTAATAAVVSGANSLVGHDGLALGALGGGSSGSVLASYNVNSPGGVTLDVRTSRVVASGNASTAVTVLANGNYLLQSQAWDGSRGLVHFGEGNTGSAGPVSAANSLVGASSGDGTGMFVQLLAGNNYVWSTPYADLGATDGGAVTWASGSTGRTGAISTSTSLYGTSHSDQVGQSVVGVGTADSAGLRANYLVLSPHWGNRSSADSTTSYGAVTWVDGSTGQALGAAGQGAAVGSSNSLVGSQSGDYVGSYHYASQRTLGYPSTHGFSTIDSNWDAVLQTGLQVLADGNYVVRSPSWGGGKGAVTWGTGSSGVAGVVSAGNSLVGSVADQVVTTTTTAVRDGKTVTDTAYELRTTGDHVGLSGAALTGGGVLVLSPFWDGGKGAATLVDGSRTGAVSAANSVVGSRGDSFSDANHTTLDSPGDRLGLAHTTNWVTPLVSTWSGQSTTSLVPVGPYSNVSQSTVSTNYSGTGVTNYVVGYRQSASPPQANQLRLLSDGNLLLAAPGWSNGGTLAAGAVTWLNGSTGAFHGGGFGAVSATNSLVGDIAGERIGLNFTNAAVSAALVDGGYLVTSTQWNANRGAVTWGNASTPAIGTISAANSLVGGAGGETVGSQGLTTLADGNLVIRSNNWGVSQGTAAAGAVTWLDARTGQLADGSAGGVVGAANSLIGSTAADGVGAGGISVLAGGAYVVNSNNWDRGSVVNAGAVTFGAAGGAVGTLSAGNSLVGSTAGDRVGSNGVTVLDTASGKHYLVRSSLWTDPYNDGAGVAGAQAGAVTWVDGSNGHVHGTGATGAEVSAGNSLVGDRAGRRVGATTQLLASGDALVLVNNGTGATAFSSASLVPGTTGLAGPLNWRNSVTGFTVNSGSQLGVAVLPGAVSAAETAAARVLVWSGLNGAGQYRSRAVAMTTLADDNGTTHRVGAINALSGHDDWTGSHFVNSAGSFDQVGGSNGLMAYTALAGDDLMITPAALTSLLNAGTNVTLQASNDIAVLRDITVQAGGNGGTLTLEAGRSVHLRANISTDNGDLVVRANQGVADGVIDSGCTTCVAVIGQAPGTRVDAGTGSIRLTLAGSTDKAGNQAGNIALSGLGAEHIQITNAGLGSSSQGQGLRFYGGADIGHTGTESLRLHVGGSSTTGGGLVLAADTRLLGDGSLTLAAADPAAAVSIGADAGSGMALKSSELAAVLASGGGFGHYILGRNDQAGATTVAALDFTQAPLLPSGWASMAADLSLRGGSGGLAITAALRTDLPIPHQLSLETGGGGNLSFGSAAAVSAGAGSLRMGTAAGGDVSQASGASLNLASLQLAVDGDVVLRAGSNQIDQLSGQAATADIRTTSSLNVGSAGLGLGGQLRLEAAGASSDLALDGVVSSAQGDLVLAAGRDFLNRNAAGTGLAAAQGRYLVYASDPATSTEGMAGYDKHYAQAYSSASTPAYAASGNWFLYSTSPTLTIAVQSGGGGQLTYGQSFSPPGLTYQGLIDGDQSAAAISGALAFQLPTYTASSAGLMPVGSHAYSLTGAGTAQSPLGYTLQVVPGSATFSVVPKSIDLQGLQALGKVYDGTTVASLQGQATVLGGGSVSSDGRFVNGDTVAIGGTASASFDTRHAGQGKTVQVSGLGLSGADAGNYTLASASLQADVTPKAVVVQGLSAPASKVYDGTPDASVLGAATLAAGLAPGAGNSQDGRPHAIDALQLTGTAWARHNAATVADATSIQFGGLALGGAGAANYTLQMGSQAGTITPKALTVADLGASAKVYDGNDLASLTGQARAVGVVNQDMVQIGGTALARFTDANAGVNKAVTVSGLLLDGAAAGNYSLTAPTLQADIQPRALQITADNQAKTYGGADPVLGYQIGGQGLAPTDQAGQVLSGALATASGAQATAGSHAITQGSLAANANYSVGFVPGTLTVAKASLTVRADDRAKTYGDADPALSHTVDASQLKYGDAASVVSGLQLATATGAAATAGSHAITVNGGSASNYTLVRQAGTLTVAKAPLTVQADAQEKVSGEQDPAFTWTVDGSQLRHGDAASVVGGLLVDVATGRGLPPGSYTIALQGGQALNYTLSLVNGVYTVTPAPSVNAEVLSTRLPTANPPVVLAASPAGAPAALPSVPAGMPLADLPAGSVAVVGGGLVPPATAGVTGATGGAGGVGMGLVVQLPASSVPLRADRSLRFDAATSFATDSAAPLQYSASLANGEPLPAWLQMDARTGVLSGVAPAGAAGQVVVVVTARESDSGRSAVTRVDLSLR